MAAFLSNIFCSFHLIKYKMFLFPEHGITRPLYVTLAAAAAVEMQLSSDRVTVSSLLGTTSCVVVVYRLPVRWRGIELFCSPVARLLLVARCRLASQSAGLLPPSFVVVPMSDIMAAGTLPGLRLVVVTVSCFV